MRRVEIHRIQDAAHRRLPFQKKIGATLDELTRTFLDGPGHQIRVVRFVLFSDPDLAVYADVLQHL